jgi:micrococcal nuclease
MYMHPTTKETETQTDDNNTSDYVFVEKQNVEYVKLFKEYRYEDTVQFTIPVEMGYVVKVYDGDTFTLAFQLANNPTVYRESVRMYGMDTPELRTGENKAEGQIAKEALTKKIMSKHVYIRQEGKEKYGRILATVYLKNNETREYENVNQWMIDEGYALPYDGKTKNQDWSKCGAYK